MYRGVLLKHGLKKKHGSEDPPLRKRKRHGSKDPPLRRGKRTGLKTRHYESHYLDFQGADHEVAEVARVIQLIVSEPE